MRCFKDPRMFAYIAAETQQTQSMYIAYLISRKRLRMANPHRKRIHNMTETQELLRLQHGISKEKLLTTAALVLDLRNGTTIAPIYMRCCLNISVDEIGVLTNTVSTAGFSSKVLRPKLIVREVTELVQTQPVRLLLLVVRMDISQVILEDLEAMLLLRKGVVHT